jgi:hypothetical protein
MGEGPLEPGVKVIENHTIPTQLNTPSQMKITQTNQGVIGVNT